jgi:hypothetical protein
MISINNHIMALFAALFLCLIDSTTPSGSSKNDGTSRQSRFKAIEDRYNLTRAKKKAAVKDAVNFLLDQEDNRNKIQKKKGNEPYISPNPTTKCEGSSCPICIVTMNAILHEGTFEYLGDDAKPPYDDHCWSARIRYHTAPACVAEEAARGVVPIYKWKWTLESAKKGYCVMPDISSPPKVAASYFNRIPEARKGNPQRNLTIMFMGLSFMGEPFMSMGCTYNNMIVGGLTSGEVIEEDLKYSVLDVKENGGICSGYPKGKIASFYPPNLHKADKDGIPKQHFETCSLDHANVVYGGGGIDQPHMDVCFIYTFNSQKNIRYGQKFAMVDDLPCRIRSWNDIDIILSIPDAREVKHWVRMTKGLEHDLRHLKVARVDKMYEGVMFSQLQAAYKEKGFQPLNPPDYKAKFEKCGPADSDVHYRLPGIPDNAIQAWLSFIATGLGHPSDENRKSVHANITMWE